jgi:hypothetical protein
VHVERRVASVCQSNAIKPACFQRIAKETAVHRFSLPQPIAVPRLPLFSLDKCSFASSPRHKEQHGGAIMATEECKLCITHTQETVVDSHRVGQLE